MYTDRNFRTKKDLKAAVLAGDVSVYQPGGFPLRDGAGVVEGPKFPEPHRFYARVTVKGGVIPKGSKVS